MEEIRAAETAYPPAPWRARGQLWAGVFRADMAAAIPAGLTPVLGRRWRIVALVRYLPGSTLQYDELMIGSLARAGLRPGIFIERLYVNNLASLWGGRRIWGLPKELASFAWDGDICRVADAGGAIAAMHLNLQPAWLPPLPVTSWGIGRMDDAWSFIATPMWARLSRANMRLLDWSPRFNYRLAPGPLITLAAKPFRAIFPPPTLVRRR